MLISGWTLPIKPTISLFTDINADFPAKYARINLKWKDVPMTYYIENESYQMEHWTVYCTSWNNVLESVWTGWGEKELQEYIDICSEYI